MAVYVDRLMPCQETAEWPYRFRSRMHADDTMKLNNMAGRLKLPISWYHPKSIPPYYDIDPKRWNWVIEMKVAILCSPEETNRICRVAKRKAAEERLCG